MKSFRRDWKMSAVSRTWRRRPSIRRKWMILRRNGSRPQSNFSTSSRSPLRSTSRNLSNSGLAMFASLYLVRVLVGELAHRRLILHRSRMEHYGTLIVRGFNQNRSDFRVNLTNEGNGYDSFRMGNDGTERAGHGPDLPAWHGQLQSVRSAWQ